MESTGGNEAAPSGVGAALVRVFWLPGLVFVLHLLFCTELGFYARYNLTDELMHPLGGFAIAFAAARGLDELRRRRVVPDPGRLQRALLIFSLTATAAVAWELSEYFADRYLGTRTLGDVEDTLFDLALGLVGALAYLVASALRGGAR